MTPRRPRLTLTWKIFLGAAAVVAVVLAGTLLLTFLSARRNAAALVDRGLDQTRQLVATFLAGDARSLAQGAQVFAQNPNFFGLIREPKPGDALDQSLEAADRIPASWVQITDENGVRLARSDDPAAPAAPLAGSPLISRALEGEVADGFGVSGDSVLFQAVAVPIAVPTGGEDGKIVGVLMAAKTIDSSLASRVKSVTASDVVFYALDANGRPHISASTLGRSDALARLVEEYVHAAAGARGTGVERDSAASLPRADFTLDGVRYVGRGAPLLSAGGAPLGGFIALRSRDAEMAAFSDLRNRIMLAGVLGLAVAFAFSFLIARRITEPVSTLVTATRRAAEGDYTASVSVRSSDEIGVLAEAFRVMLTDLRDKQALVEVLTVANDSRGASESSTSRWQPIRSQELRMLVPGKVFAGRYEIIDTIGVGGMGVVYKALDRELGETIVIKALRPEFLHADPTALERFKSEIRLARRIAHRNVVRTYDLGEADGLYFITMEYVAGRQLKEIIGEQRRLPVPATLTIGKQLCRALEVAHEEGIIHRDIKPQNLLVSLDGVLKVMDFGIARLIERQRGVTQTGLVVGTPEYMAPEQLLGDDVDARADIYSVGVVLYECLTGQRPWAADSPVTLIGKMLSEPPEPPIAINADVPQPLSDLIVRTLSSIKEDRPQSATELHDALERLDVELEPQSSTRVGSGSR